MRSYKLFYSEFWKQIIVLTTLPMLLFFPLVMFLINVKNLSDTMLFIVIFGMISLVIIATVYIFKKHANVLTSVSVMPGGIDITFDRKTWFYRIKHLFIPYSNITTVTDDEDVQNNNRKFYNISLKRPSKRIILSAPPRQAPIEMQQFSLELHTAVGEFNASSQMLGATPIKDGSFYTGTFSKVLTFVCILIMIVMAVVKISDPESVPWYKLVWFYCLSFAWIANYARARKKEKEKAGNV